MRKKNRKMDANANDADSNERVNAFDVASCKLQRQQSAATAVKTPTFSFI